MKKHSAVIFVLAMFILCLPLSYGAEYGGTAPRVTATNPDNGATDVDPSLSKVTVTFNKQMTDGSWSWSYEDKSTFPRIEGQPYYTDDGKTCVLPVRLEAGKRYVIWINTSRFKNFKDRNGTPVEPYRFTFSTRH